ncbi:MAG TPA: hypothetical protein VF445_08750 [Bordetella sp.]|uniref:hypothetical protein n=1 Tax=Bordetella sp. TaxID=28081 RepID=UPI002ED3A2DC
MKNRPLIWMLIVLTLTAGLSACFFPDRGGDGRYGNDHYGDGHHGDGPHGGGEHHEGRN